MSKRWLNHGHGGGGKTTVHTGPTTIVVTDTQIYLNIVSGDGSARYLSAPLAVSASSRTSR
jgi:hypothetical protein